MLISDPPETPGARAMYEAARREDGYVPNHDRLWSWRPAVNKAFLVTRRRLSDVSPLSMRERAVIVCATARRRDDAYCALAWGSRLAELASPDIAGALLATGDVSALSSREKALAAWAEKVASAPTSTQASDIAALKAAGLSDQEIVDATLFIAFRLAFCTVNDALGAAPDQQLSDAAPSAVREAVTYGRRAAESLSR